MCPLTWRVPTGLRWWWCCCLLVAWRVTRLVIREKWMPDRAARPCLYSHSGLWIDMLEGGNSAEYIHVPSSWPCHHVWIINRGKEVGSLLANTFTRPSKRDWSFYFPVKRPSDHPNLTHAPLSWCWLLWVWDSGVSGVKSQRLANNKLSIIICKFIRPQYFKSCEALIKIKP